MENTKSLSKVGLRKWVVFILIGLIGQFAWSIENMYLNTYITYLNFTDPSGGFNYSTLIALTTALSAIVAAITTIFMGSLTDKVNKRKIFISIGYIVWGIATASFGLFNVGSDSSLLVIPMTAYTAAIMVIVVDCIMTFFGSTANDAAFNSYVTKNTNKYNRGKVEGVLNILPLIAMLIIFVGLNNLTTESGGNRWDLFFYIVGGLVAIVGVVSIFLIPKETKDESISQEEEEKANKLTYWQRIIEGFKPSTIKNNKMLYLVLLTYVIYGIAIQVFFPYLMVYIQYTCGISNTGDSILTDFAIVMAVALLVGSILSVIVGTISDKISKEKMLIPSIILLIIGCILMFIIPYINDGIGKIIYAAFAGVIMIAGYIIVPTICNSMVKNYMPKGQEGSYMGVRMIFVVMLPMCIGPFIGDALNANLGSTYLSEYGVESVVPTNYGYIVGAAILLLCFIPIYFIFKNIKNDKLNNNEIYLNKKLNNKRTKNNGYLFKDLKQITSDDLIYDLKEHPRPNFYRDNFVNLVGEWEYAIRNSEEIPEVFDGKIIVPFAVESPVSLVNRLLTPDEFLFYKKVIEIQKPMQNLNIFLNFEGVDQICSVYINKKEVYKHVGGYTRFSVNISPYINDYDNVEIILKVQDLTDTSYHMIGKQKLNPSFCFYSSSSGVYKPIYLEYVGVNYIKSVKYNPLYDEKAIEIIINTNIDGDVKVNLNNKTYIVKRNKKYKYYLTDNFKEWNLDNPYLYDVTFKFYNDVVHSYFGIRKIEIKKDKDNNNKIYLNNKPIIINGLLDQGYYFIGGLTPRSFKEYENDILNVKSLGFNTLRKHIKVECDYFYYLADKYGLLIIQDIPNGGEPYPFINVAIPRLNINLFNDEKYVTYKKFGRLNKEGREKFIKDTKQIISDTSNFPSVIIYTLFNEGWGQFDAGKLYKELKPVVNNQLLDSTSGWLDSKDSDFFSIHAYIFQTKKRKDKKGNRPYFLSEVGGLGLKIKDNFYYKKGFGHGLTFSQTSLEKKYVKLYKGLIKRIKDSNLVGIIYTQLNDCETEYNGIYTLDRKVLKVNEEYIKKINNEINYIFK